MDVHAKRSLQEPWGPWFPGKRIGSEGTMGRVIDQIEPKAPDEEGSGMHIPK